MKVEFDGQKMRAEMNTSDNNTQNKPSQNPSSIYVIKEFLGLVLGVLSAFSAFLLLPIAAVLEAYIHFMVVSIGLTASYCIAVAIIVCTIIAIVSIVCGIISTVMYVKTNKKSNLIGMIFSIVGFVACPLSIAFIIVSFIL